MFFFILFFRFGELFGRLMLVSHHEFDGDVNSIRIRIHIPLNNVRNKDFLIILVLELY